MNEYMMVAYAASKNENIAGAVVALQGATPHIIDVPVSKREARKYARYDHKRAKCENKRIQKQAQTGIRQNKRRHKNICAQANKTPSTKNESLFTWRMLLAWASTCIFAFCLGIWFFGNVVSFVVVSGLSMEPTLEDGDYLFVTRYVNSLSDGDIVVINLSDNPEDTSNMIVKRVVATAGQTVQISHDGTVFVDGTAELQNFDCCIEPGLAITPIVVPDGQIFVLGDNRNNSFDSRYIGCIPTSQVYGEVLLYGDIPTTHRDSQDSDVVKSMLNALRSAFPVLTEASVAS